MADEYFYSNKECPYYPCHPEIPEQNCKFCYCPLYFYKCLGDYDILPNGIKDCSRCSLPHTRQGAKEIVRLLTNEFDSFRESGFPELKDLSNPCKGCIDNDRCGHTDCLAYSKRYKSRS